MVIAHEAGHILGGSHQDPNNDIFHIMDQFYDPAVSSGAVSTGFLVREMTFHFDLVKMPFRR